MMGSQTMKGFMRGTPPIVPIQTRKLYLIFSERRYFQMHLRDTTARYLPMARQAVGNPTQWSATIGIRGSYQSAVRRFST